MAQTDWPMVDSANQKPRTQQKAALAAVFDRNQKHFGIQKQR